MIIKNIYHEGLQSRKIKLSTRHSKSISGSCTSRNSQAKSDEAKTDMMRTDACSSTRSTTKHMKVHDVKAVIFLISFKCFRQSTGRRDEHEGRTRIWTGAWFLILRRRQVFLTFDSKILMGLLFLRAVIGRTQLL